MMAKIK